MDRGHYCPAVTPRGLRVFSVWRTPVEERRLAVNREIEFWPFLISLDLVRADQPEAFAAVLGQVSRFTEGEGLDVSHFPFQSLSHVFQHAGQYASFPTSFYVLPTSSQWSVIWTNTFHCDGYDSLCHCLSLFVAEEGESGLKPENDTRGVPAHSELRRRVAAGEWRGSPPAMRRRTRRCATGAARPPGAQAPTKAPPTGVRDVVPTLASLAT